MSICREIFDISALSEHGLPVVRVVIAEADGSTPREAGAVMEVTESGICGTIGGGQLEFEVIAHARNMIDQAKRDRQAWPRDLRTWPLGPSLGQCCGGTVRVLFELYDYAELGVMDAGTALCGDGGLIIHPVAAGKPLHLLTDRQDTYGMPLPVARAARDMLSGARPRQPCLVAPRGNGDAYFIEPLSKPRQPLFIYGAGHVGRAIVKVIDDLGFAVYWVDVAADRFPGAIAQAVEPVIAADPAVIAEAAPAGAYHIVLTFSHALDLSICHALLAKASFGFLGLIGSKSKRARFLKRLTEAGIPPVSLERLVCPIGIGELQGKAPATIAISVAAQLVAQSERNRHQAGKQGEGKLGEDERISS